MHKRFVAVFEKANNQLDERKQTFASECFEENKDNSNEFAECLKQKEELLAEVPDKLEAYNRFALLKSTICLAHWDDSRQCIKDAREKLNEAAGGLFTAEE